MLDERAQVIDVPVGPVRFGHEAGELAREVLGFGQGAQSGSPALHLSHAPPFPDRWLREVVDHEVDRRQGAYGVDCGRQLTWLQEQVEGESTAIVGIERSVDRTTTLVDPRIRVPCRVEKMMVSIDRHAGVGASSGNRCSARSSVQSPGGIAT